jgi:hypothetical protein
VLESLEDFFVLESKGSRSRRGSADAHEQDTWEGVEGPYVISVFLVQKYKRFLLRTTK